MSDPIATPDDLSVFLGQEVDYDRAVMLLAHAQALCESILTPLPDSAAGIVLRIAARAYVNVTSATEQGAGPFTVSYTATGAGGAGGMYLSRSDKADLRRLAGGGGAFSIDVLPPDYSLSLPWWDNLGTTS